MARMFTNWKKLKFLGAGAYGKVYLASLGEPSLPCALQAAVKSADIQASSTLRRECMFLGELRGHPNIIRCFGEDISTEKGKQVYNLLLEYAPGGNLHDFINQNKCTIPETHIAGYTYMLLKGLSAIHGREIIHGDLKPGNILVFPKENGINQLKIADFGAAERLQGAELSEDVGGTPAYTSPECLISGLLGTASDIWSLGCIVVEMVTGKRIWLSDAKVPENMSEDGKDFLRKCFELEVKKRWTAEKLSNHPFIVKNMKLLYGTDHPSPDSSEMLPDIIQSNPFGFGDSISTTDLFSTSLVESECSRACVDYDCRDQLEKNRANPAYDDYIK